MGKQRILNTRVYGLEESIIRSGYAMDAVSELPNMAEAIKNLTEKDFGRAIMLGNSRVGSGHDCFLKGIRVQADFEAPQYFWHEWRRYHFQDTITSQSTMHRILKFNLAEKCNERVDARIIAITEEKITAYLQNENAETFEDIIANIPQGLLLGVGIDTNYLELKSMAFQRYGHKVSFWRETFFDWLFTLPKFVELALQKHPAFVAYEYQSRIGR